MTQAFDISALAAQFEGADELATIEKLADDLGSVGASTDPETRKVAIEALLYRLGDGKVQSDDDVEDALCGALVRLRVMTKLGNRNYRFVNDFDISTIGSAKSTSQVPYIPVKYSASD